MCHHDNCREFLDYGTCFNELFNALDSFHRSLLPLFCPRVVRGRLGERAPDVFRQACFPGVMQDLRREEHAALRAGDPVHDGKTGQRAELTDVAGAHAILLVKE